MAETVRRLAAIAIGRNEGARLERCLRSLEPARVPVVYVDSGSTDGSEDLARRIGATVHELATDRPFTAARARAEGFTAMLAKMPEPDYVMFVAIARSSPAGWNKRWRSWTANRVMPWCAAGGASGTSMHRPTIG